MRYTTTHTGVEPVTMQQVKDHLRISWEEEDALIYSLLVAAREYVEKTTSQAVIPQQIKAYYMELPYLEGYLDLPLSNAVAIASVKYLDGSGTQITLSSDEYYLTVGQPSRVYFSNGVSGGLERLDAVEIIYTAGFGPAPFKDFPQAIKAAMLIMVADLYEHREAQGTQKFEQNMTVDRLLNQNRELGL